MKRLGAQSIFWIIGTASSVASFATMHVLDSGSQLLVEAFFQEHLREPLFIGLLTVAAFLFSLQTFIIVTMKEKLYDTDHYRDHVEELKTLNKAITRYGPLSNFNGLLFLAVLISLIAAVAQFTVGLWDQPYAAAACIATALWSIAMIFISLIVLQSNLTQWFRFLQ